MLKKINLLFLSLLILCVLLLSSCFLNPPVTEGILKGQIMVPEGTLKIKDLTGQALPDATVNILDLTTGAIIATTVTDSNGYYQVSIPPGGPYLLEAVKGFVILEQMTCQVEVGIEYDLGIADCTTTAAALIAQAMMDAGIDLTAIDCDAIETDEHFTQVMTMVCNVIKKGEDPTVSSAIALAVQNFLNPPAPPTPPLPPPTYTVTYDGNGNTGGTVPTDANTYESGEEVTVSDNTGSLEKTQDGISLLFAGWNTASDGSGISYHPGNTFAIGSSNLTLYAHWSALRCTGPAGGLIFHDKGEISDGWRYLEAAPIDQSTGIKWNNGTDIYIGADGEILGSGASNTTKIINSQGETTTDYAAGLARAYNGGGYDDWFLPSRHELSLMYPNLKTHGVGGFADASYWSSSESDTDKAWVIDFKSGCDLDDEEKSLNTLYVRAVRVFRALCSTEPTYIVNYNANGATGGTVPSDSYHYEPTETVTVLGNTGTLVKAGYTFAGWNTQADGNGTDYTEGYTFNMGNANEVLYAKWMTTIDIAAIPGVTAPITGATPVTAITETSQYTGTVAWSPNHGTFAGSTVYAATITLTAKTGFTFIGVAENFFTVAGAKTVTNEANSGIVTAVFPETASVKVGDSCGGGKVAYILQSVDPGYVTGETHGLIAAAADAPDQMMWSNITNTLIGTTGRAIGDGQANTAAIVGQTGCTSGAAYYCDNIEGVYSDWFLPSKDELYKLYINRVAIGGFADNYSSYYWSSSEFNEIGAWYGNFRDGSFTNPSGKDHPFHVRAVRDF